MTALETTRLVAGRELRQAVRRKSLWITFLILLIGSTAAVVLPEVISGDGATTYDVALVGGDGELGQSLRAQEPALDARVELSSVRDAAAAVRLVEDGDVDLAIVAGERPSIVVRAGEHAELVGAARQALFASGLGATLRDEGLSPTEIAGAVQIVPARLRELDTSSESRQYSALALSVVLYLLLLVLMGQVANATAIEKANRISEVLLPIARPASLLFGKVIGVTITGMVVISGALVPAAVKFALGGDLPPGIGGALAGSAAWFVLGLGLYLTLAGGLGALAERQEEAGPIVMPLTAVLVGAFFATQAALDTSLGTVLAYVPLTSPVVEPARIAAGSSGAIEVVGSLALLVVAIVVAGRFASTIYARAIIRTGRRLKLRDVLGPRSTASDSA